MVVDDINVITSVITTAAKLLMICCVSLSLSLLCIFFFSQTTKQRVKIFDKSLDHEAKETTFSLILNLSTKEMLESAGKAQGKASRAESLYQNKR